MFVKRLFFLLAMLPALLIAQKVSAPNKILWQQCVGGTAFDDALATELLPDSSFLVAATTRSYDVPGLEKTTGDADIMLFKVNLLGKVIWKKSYGGKYTEEPADVKYLPDGGFVVSGYTDSPEYTKGENDLFIMRVDALGRLRWAKGYGGTGNERGNSLLPTPDGGFLIAGETGSKNNDVKDNHGGLDGWLVKLDAQGNLQWEKALGGSLNDKLKVLVATKDGHYLVAGPSDSPNGDLPGNLGKNDVLLAKLKPDGTPLWVKNIGGDSYDDIFGLKELPDGDILMVGTTYSTNGTLKRQYGENDVYIARLDKDGNVKWAQSYGGAEDEGGNSIQLTALNTLLVAGTSRSRDGLLPDCYGKYDGWLLETDLQGKLLWSQNYGGSKSEVLCAAHRLADGSILAMGSTGSIDYDLNYTNTYGGNDAWILNLGYKPRTKDKVPTTLVGYVRDAKTKEVIPAEVSLIKVYNNKVIASAKSDTTIGTYWMSFTDTSYLSLGVQVPGYMFYSAALSIPKEQQHEEVRYDIDLQPIEVGSTLNLRNIHFDLGKATIRPESNAELDRIVRFLQLNPKVRIRIGGHTDDSGAPDTKQVLSQFRAKSVVEYLVDKGILKNRIDAVGYGMSKPLVPNTTEENRQLNRRVEVEIIAK